MKKYILSFILSLILISLNFSCGDNHPAPQGSGNYAHTIMEELEQKEYEVDTLTISEPAKDYAKKLDEGPLEKKKYKIEFLFRGDFCFLYLKTEKGTFLLEGGQVNNERISFGQFPPQAETKIAVSLNFSSRIDPLYEQENIKAKYINNLRERIKGRVKYPDKIRFEIYYANPDELLIFDIPKKGTPLN